MTGDDLTLPVTILIGDTDCINVTLVNSTELHCYYDATQPTTEKFLPISIYYRNTTPKYYRSSFKYTETNCSHCRGICQEGICVCDADFYSGVSCTILVSRKIEPIINATGGMFPLTRSNTTGFNVTLTKLVEIDANDRQVELLTLTRIKWSEDPTNSFNQSTILNCSCVTGSVNVTINSLKLLHSKISTEFGGQVITVPMLSLKHNVRISGWKFANLTNRLQAIYHFTFPPSLPFTRGTQLVKSNITVDTINGNLVAFDINTPQAVFLSQFPNRVIIDGNAQIMDIKVVNTTAGSLTVQPGMESHA
eukprot:gene14999-17735_t